MSYVRSILQPEEHVIMMGKLHWIIFDRAIAVTAVGLLLLGLEFAYGGSVLLIQLTAATFGVLALLFFLHAWFIRWITEFGVTNRRLIYKRGFINRYTAEMNLDKVESIDVDQSVLGRILGYGTVRILGTGQGMEQLQRIASPIELRHAIIAK